MTTQKRSVLLIHGIDDTARIFDKMAVYLRDRTGADIHTLNLIPNNGDLGLDALAWQVKAYVDCHLAHVDRLDLVGFSMGGIVGRYYVQKAGGLHRVNRLITLSSPHNGTWTGFLRPNIGACQMRPHSPFLRTLNRTAHDLQKVKFTSLWTPYDLMIVPAHSSLLAVGTMVQLPVLAHPLMVSDERSLATVAQKLTTH